MWPFYYHVPSTGVIFYAKLLTISVRRYYCHHHHHHNHNHCRYHLAVHVFKVPVTHVIVNVNLLHTILYFGP